MTVLTKQQCKKIKNNFIQPVEPVYNLPAIPPRCELFREENEEVWLCNRGVICKLHPNPAEMDPFFRHIAACVALVAWMVEYNWLIKNYPGDLVRIYVTQNAGQDWINWGNLGI